MLRLLTFLFLVLTFVSCEEVPEPGMQVLVKNKFDKRVIDSYWLYLPPDHSEDKTWPIIMFLQGQDGISADPTTCKEAGPVTLRNSNLSLVNEFIIINPHMTIGPLHEREWSQHSKTLLQILEDVRKNYSGDSTRYYLTGLSLGATGTWAISKKHPDVFAAIVPISGRLNCNANCDKVVTTPMWIVHNQQDRAVSSTYSSNTVKFLEENFSVKFTRLLSVGSTDKKALAGEHLFALPQSSDHDAWTKAYNSVQLYQWLLSKKKER